MSPGALLSDLRSRGVELRPSDDLRRVLFRGASNADRVAIAREKLWLLMLLAHELGADAYDPRLAFLASAERGLTWGAIRDRMRTAFGIDDELAEALVELAESAGYLRVAGELYHAVGDVSSRARASE